MGKYLKKNFQLILGLSLMAIGLLHSSCAHAKDVRVLVIDSGVSVNHMFLLKYVEAGPYEDTLDDIGHGTHVAGIIAGSGCPNLKIVSCKAFFKGHAVLNRVHDCLQKAIDNKFDIVNFSGGGESSDDEEYKLIKQISDKGTQINVAAGNGIPENHKKGKSLGSPCFGYFPACYTNIDNLNAVGSKSVADNISWFSNYGLIGEKWEYGEDVYSTLPDNKYGRMSGTSMATAAFTMHMVQDMCYK